MSRFPIVPISLPRRARLLVVAPILALSIAWFPASGVAPSDAASAIAVTHGAFVNGDSLHRGEGTATVYRLSLIHI